MASETTLHDLLKQMVEMGGSDLHLTTQSPPQVRLDGKLMPLALPGADGRRRPSSSPTRVLTDAQKHRFEEKLELDFSFGVKGIARFRANNFIQRGAVAGVYRQIPYEIRASSELGLPPVVETLVRQAARPDPRHAARPAPASRRRWRRCSTRSTARSSCTSSRSRIRSSSSTSTRSASSTSASCTPTRTRSPNALRAVLREDPDVVLIGEMRDLETIEAALRIAETGHLTFGHAAHELGRADDQPHHRRLPGAPAGADPHAAVVRARGDRVPDAAPSAERQGARHGARDPRAERRRSGT